MASIPFPNSQGNPAGAIPVYIGTAPSGASQPALTMAGLPAPTDYVAATLNSASGTTPSVLIPAAAQPGYYITSIGLQVDSIATIAAAGEVNMVISDSSYGTIFNIRFYIPATAGSPATPQNLRVVTEDGFWWNNKVANSTLSCNLGTALTAGSVRFFARYGRWARLG